jgi:acyl carrier protein
MEPTRFDALVRTLLAATTRRGVVGLLLGAGIAGFDRETLAKKARKRTPRKGGARAQRRRQGKGDGNPTRRTAKNRNSRLAGAEATQCCATGNCVAGKGKNLAQCCFQGQDLSGKNLSGANLGSANFSAATLTGSSVQGANLGKTCFVDADLTGLRTNASTNWNGAILCRTRTDAGEDNSGCGRGTPCCPTCDDRHPCGDDEVCCNGRCTRGNCCVAADCPNEPCQRRSCQRNQCTSVPVAGEPGPRCQSVCCEDESGDPECCPEAATACDDRGRCCTPETKDQTCGVGTTRPRCGEVTNTCGRRVDCGSCAEKTCQVAVCRAQDNTCIYESSIGGPGTGCQTVCCWNEIFEPVCCDAGVSTCLPSGRCGCGRDADCGADEQCCAGNCIARSRCCEGANPAGCGGDLHCCVSDGDGVCRECCADGDCAPGATCQNGTCQTAATTFERVRAIVATFFGVEEATMTMDTEFARDLGADSLDMVEILLALEEEFGLVIEDEELGELEDIRTVGDAVRAIDALLESRAILGLDRRAPRFGLLSRSGYATRGELEPR